MGFLCSRVKPSNLKILWIQLSRSYHYQTSAFISNYRSNSQIRVCDRANSALIQCPHFDFPRNVRFFAAPVQAKPKQETKHSSGPRLNEKILADVIRLVNDDGHDVVSRTEALRRASALNLDLVEVDRNAKPPVCKIMDYHREKYNKQVKDKDRVKSKSEVTLRKGDCKEVRFSMKIEQKDLEMKANTVKKMMERGYRVKCMATGKEEEDLGGLVARLSALIEDVAIVESGPRVEKKQAYIVVRHIKFGLPKKGGSPKKTSKPVEAPNPDTQNHSDINSSPFEDDEIADQSVLETDDESPPEENRYKRPDNTPVLENRYKKPDNSPVMENRYNRVNNSIPAENRYNRVNNSAPIENRYSRENNRYNRVNNATPTDIRYNRENNVPAAENRYRRDQQYSPNVEGGSERVKQFTQFRPNNMPSDSSFLANNSNLRERPQENRYRHENSFENQPRPQGSPLAPPNSILNQ